MIPYELEVMSSDLVGYRQSYKSNNNQYDEGYEHQQMDDGNEVQTNNLTQDESHQFYLQIKDALCEAPYACSMIL